MELTLIQYPLFIITVTRITSKIIERVRHTYTLNVHSCKKNIEYQQTDMYIKKTKELYGTII
jgi:hypothetical protein